MKRGRQVTEAASPATAQPRRRAPWAYPRSSARVGTPTSAQSWRTPLPQGLGPRARLERPQAPRRRWSWTPRAPGGPRAQGRRRLAAPRTVSEAASRAPPDGGRGAAGFAWGAARSLGVPAAPRWRQARRPRPGSGWGGSAPLRPRGAKGAGGAREGRRGPAGPPRPRAAPSLGARGPPPSGPGGQRTPASGHSAPGLR